MPALRANSAQSDMNALISFQSLTVLRNVDNVTENNMKKKKIVNSILVYLTVHGHKKIYMKKSIWIVRQKAATI